jgi:hypothetical protein
VAEEKPSESPSAVAESEAPVTPQPAEIATPVALVAQEVAAPVAPPAEINARRGYGFLNVSTGHDTARLSGENVSSMFVMTEPIATEAVAPAPSEPAAKAAVESPAPAPKPKATAKPVATGPKTRRGVKTYRTGCARAERSRHGAG